jgi:hypothetical protein
MILIYIPAVISGEHEDGIDSPKSYKAATKSPLAEKWDMMLKAVSDVVGQG